MMNRGAEDDDADFGDGSTFDSAFEFLQEEPAAALDSAVASTATTTAEASSTTLSSVVNALAHQIPSSPGGAGKSLQWAPELVTYMGTSTSSLDFATTDDDAIVEGSVHLSEASFDMKSVGAADGGGDAYLTDDFNSGMRNFSFR
jgi:hypothetical protein